MNDKTDKKKDSTPRIREGDFRFLEKRLGQEDKTLTEEQITEKTKKLRPINDSEQITRPRLDS